MFSGQYSKVHIMTSKIIIIIMIMIMIIIPSRKSQVPTGLLWTDGKRPDGVSLVPWQSGKSICWDVTVTCPLAE